MGHIKEPNGIDLVINSRPLTKEEEIAISEYIRSYKSKQTKNHSPKIARKVRTKRAGKAITKK